MKVVQINSVCGSGSTGKICVAVSEMLTVNGIENYIFYASGKSDYPLGRKYMASWEIKFYALISRILGNYGFVSKISTRRLLKMLDEISPDIVHLHNLHSHNIELRTLFRYLKKKNVKVFWTFHDCWTFTSYCMYFDMVYCNQWKKGCEKCPQYKKYSWIFDRSKWLYSKKKELFLGIDLTIITPSEWLASLVKESFFKEYPIKVIHNGVNLDVFVPTPSSFRALYGISEDRFVLLGVAFDWGKRKGLDVFVKLAEMLDEKYQIVLVGTNDELDKRLPRNIITIHRTHRQNELAEIYSAADLFVNPTREEVLGLTNIEANACGTPVVTFKTGGSPECIDKTSGSVIERDDIEGLICEIKRICVDKPYSIDACVNKSKDFEMNLKFNDYIRLYQG